MKIAVAVNRFKIANPKAVWELGRLSWRDILRGPDISTFRRQKFETVGNDRKCRVPVIQSRRGVDLNKASPVFSAVYVGCRS